MPFQISPRNSKQRLTNSSQVFGFYALDSFLGLFPPVPERAEQKRIISNIGRAWGNQKLLDRALMEHLERDREITKRMETARKIEYESEEQEQRRPK